jgi:hypothetical protein
MSHLLALMLQVTTASLPPPHLDDFDLARLPPAPTGCDRPASGDEIVVCGRSKGPPTIENRWIEAPLRVGVDLPGGSSLSVEAEQRSLPGANAPAAMARFTIPF